MSKWSLHFIGDGWKDYIYWQKIDKKMIKKINGLLAEMQRTPFEGLGKPELLKGDLSGAWSRRINDEHRLIYIVVGDEIRVIGCRFHYAKK